MTISYEIREVTVICKRNITLDAKLKIDSNEQE